MNVIQERIRRDRAIELRHRRRRERVAMIIYIQFHPDADLMKVAQALHHLSTLLGLAQRRQKHSRENGNNGDYDEQFDEGEGRAPP